MSEENRVSEVRPVSRMRIGVHVGLVLLGAVLFLTGVRGLGSLLAIGSTLNIALLLVRPALRGRSPGTQALFPVFILVAIGTPIFVGGAITNLRESKPVGWLFLALVIVGLLTLVSLVRSARRYNRRVQEAASPAPDRAIEPHKSVLPSFEGFRTPREAAVAGFDLARVVRVRRSDWDCTLDPEEGHLEVEIETTGSSTGYRYFVHVHRVGDLWYQGSSHN